MLRALDTVEDDMAIPVSTKVPLLRAFYERAGDETFTMDDCGGPGNYGRLMRGYPAVARTFNGLQPGYRAVVADITRRMGNGMADFIERQDVRTVEDYDLYCHYVAGLVGVGLTDVSRGGGGEGLFSFLFFFIFFRSKKKSLFSAPAELTHVASERKKKSKK